MLRAASTPGLLPRHLAWKILQAVAAGAYADIALGRALKHADLLPADRTLATELAYGAIRRRRWLDAWLDRLGRVPARQQPPLLRWLLHLGLYQIFWMQRIPASAAINTSVELAKSTELAQLASVVNGLLRSAQRARDTGESLELPKDLAAALALKQSLPLWFCQDLITWYGADRAKTMALACNRVPTLDLRVNRLCQQLGAVQCSLAAAGITAMPIPDCPYGLQVPSAAGSPRHWPGYSEGHWSIQDRAAQAIAPLLEAKPGERLLDACAAPGGKSTHLAELIGDHGEVWAVDRSAGRLRRVTANATRLGCTSIRVMTANAVGLSTQYPELYGYFDRILLDAPCSGLGTLARHADARWRVTPLVIDTLITLQSQLLEGLLRLLHPGGRLVYSTCTIHPAENNCQIDRLLQRHPELRMLGQHQHCLDDVGGGDGFYTAVLELI